ncbi:MAG: hypothetical protein K6G50_13955 [bacterium]|nr:hypothetical protein [bacterium]
MAHDNPFEDSTASELRIAGAKADGTSFVLQGSCSSNAGGEVPGLAVCIMPGTQAVSCGQVPVFAPREPGDRY